MIIEIGHLSLLLALTLSSFTILISTLGYINNWLNFEKLTMLKNIGTAARLQMQLLIEGPVFLELFVKVSPDWRSKPARLAQLGYELK